MYDDVFLHAFVYLLAAVVAVPVAKILGLGSVLGYLAAGVMIGPFGFGLVGGEAEDIMHFSEFGVVMMLFLVGLELRPSELWRLRGSVLGLGGLQVALTAAIGTGIGMGLGLEAKPALAAGLILSLSSTAIVLQVLQERGLLKSVGGQNAFSVLLFQDIAVIPILAILPWLGQPSEETTGDHGGHSSWVETLPAYAQTLAVLAAVATIILAGRFVIRPAFRWIAKAGIREIFTAAALLIVVGIGLLMNAVGLSPALGTFLAGVVLASHEYRHELETDIEPFKALLLGLFFISVGGSIDFSLVQSELTQVIGIVLMLILVKMAIVFVLSRAFKMGLDQGILIAISLAQGGEFCFVLISAAVQGGALGEALSATLVAAVALSMTSTPLLMLVAFRWILPRFGTKEVQEREPDSMSEDAPVIIAGFGRFGHIVGRFLRAHGVKCTVLDVDSEHVEILRRLGIQVFYGDASRVDLLKAAGAEQAKVMIIAMDDPHKITEVARTARDHFPHLRIMARAYGRPHAYELLGEGIEAIYRETLDTSLRMAVDTMAALGYRSHSAMRAARTFRRLDEEAVREMAVHWGDRNAYANHARQRIQEMEKVIARDFYPSKGFDEGAWDSECIRKDFGEPDDTPDPGSKSP